MLQDQLDALKAEYKAGGFSAPTARQISLMDRATDELIASGQARRALKAGDRAPDFTLPDQDGVPVPLQSLLAAGPLLISFYRGVWCRFCNLELRALQQLLPEIERRGAGLVAITPQSGPASRESRRQGGVTFPILSDARSEIAAKFGIRFQLPGYLIDLYRSFKHDLPRVNDDDSWVLPMPARYVIDRDGVIAYSEINPDYTQRPDPSELLPVLFRLAKEESSS